MENKKVIYYKDELNDEFSKAKIKPRIIDKNFKFVCKSGICDIIKKEIRQDNQCNDWNFKLKGLNEFSKYNKKYSY